MSKTEEQCLQERTDYMLNSALQQVAAWKARAESAELKLAHARTDAIKECLAAIQTRAQTAKRTFSGRISSVDMLAKMFTQDLHELLRGG